MNWEELEKKHTQEWKTFEELKRKAWEDLEKNRQAMYAAFGDQEAKIPMSVYERVERDRNEWRNAWEDDGYKARYLLAIQKKERDALKENVKSSILAQMKEAREKSKERSKTTDKDREWDD